MGTAAAMDRALVFILICVFTLLVAVVGDELRGGFVPTTSIQLDLKANPTTR